MILKSVVGLLLYREVSSNKTILLRKLFLTNIAISFLSTFISIPITGYWSNYWLFLPFSYPLGLSYSVAPEAVYPPHITWYVWLFFPSLEYHFDLQLDGFQFFLVQTSFFFLFLGINAITLVTILILRRKRR